MPKARPLPVIADTWRGWRTDATVHPITKDDDGDTVKVDVTREFTLRIDGCWCAETHTRELEEKKIGEAARDYLREILEARGYDVRVDIKADPGHNVGRRTSMGRFLADVFVRPSGKEKDWRSVAELMCEAGHAFPTKEALEDHLRSLGVYGRFVNKRPKGS